MDDWKIYTSILVAFLVVVPMLIWAALALRLKGDTNLLECERMYFDKKIDYYACVQAREAVCIRQILEKYD